MTQHRSEDRFFDRYADEMHDYPPHYYEAVNAGPEDDGYAEARTPPRRPRVGAGQVTDDDS